MDSVIGQLKGQLTRHVRVSGQNASCTVVSHFAELTVAFFSFSLFNENVQPQPISSFFFKFFYDYRPNWTPLGLIWLLMTNGVTNSIVVLIGYVICYCMFSGQLTPGRENVQYKAAVD